MGLRHKRGMTASQLPKYDPQTQARSGLIPFLVLSSGYLLVARYPARIGTPTPAGTSNNVRSIPSGRAAKRRRYTA
jgi:hypothetical protein